MLAEVWNKKGGEKKNKETRGRTRDISSEKKNVKVIFFMDYSA